MNLVVVTSSNETMCTSLAMLPINTPTIFTFLIDLRIHIYSSVYIQRNQTIYVCVCVCECMYACGYIYTSVSNCIFSPTNTIESLNPKFRLSLRLYQHINRHKHLHHCRSSHSHCCLTSTIDDIRKHINTATIFRQLPHLCTNHHIPREVGFLGQRGSFIQVERTNKTNSRTDCPVSIN